MAQYRTGTASTVNGSPTVTGVGTSWLSEVSPNDFFIISGNAAAQDKVSYVVAGIISDTEIQLSVPYAGSPYTDQSYVIHRDFTSSGLPLMQDGELETVYLFNKVAEAVTDSSGFGSAAFVDTGTNNGEVPLNDDLGSAAYIDTGTDPAEIPTNNDLSSGAFTTVGTAATKDTGAAVGQVLLADELGANSGSIYDTSNYQPNINEGVNYPVVMLNLSGGTIAADATIAGSNLRWVRVDTSGNSTTLNSAMGTWKNISGATIPANIISVMTKVSQ